MSSHRWANRTDSRGKLLYQICQTHGTDHGLATLELAVEEAKAGFISAGCQNPTAQQAEIFPWNRSARRHPHAGKRPEWSGYCVIDRCACDCHDNEPLEIEEI